MKPLNRAIRDQGSSILTRAAVLEAGGSDRIIAGRLQTGVWTHKHPGVYLWGPNTGAWLDRLGLGVAAAGPAALVSHRAAFMLWGLEGLVSKLVELTVPYSCGPVPEGVIVHRTRRELLGEIRSGLPVTSVERTLLDCCSQLPTMVIAKGMNHAIRNDLTTPQRLWQTADSQGGRGVRGAGLYRRVLADLTDGGPTGSPAETEALTAMRKAGVPEPVLQWEVRAPSGRRYLVDFGWPDVDKGVEIDGLDAHAGGEKLERDLARQNDILAAGIELRRFTGRAVRRSPATVAEAIRRFLLDDDPPIL
jgi:hypothetical protein